MEWKKIAKLALIAAGVYVCFRFLLPVFFPFLLALLLVRLVRSFVDFAGRRLHLKRSVAAILFCVLFFLLLLFFAYRLILYISSQGIQFVSYCRKNYPIWQQGLRGFCCECDQYLGLKDGTLHQLLTNGISGVLAQAGQYLSEHIPERLIRAVASCAGIFVTAAIVSMASLLLYQDYEEIIGELRKQKYFCWLSKIRGAISTAGASYLKAQGTIVLCIIFYNALGLWLLGYSNTFFLGVLIGIIDFLPILGSGTVLLPWMFLLLIQRNYGTAVGIFLLYLLCSFTRQYLEPRLMGKNHGIRPFYMFLCIYLGLHLFGLWGVFLGPLGAVLIIGIYREWEGAKEEGVAAHKGG